MRKLALILMTLMAPAATPTDTPSVFYGLAAVAHVSALEGRPLSLAERRVVIEEGYVSHPYKDTKGNLTSGVGQTGAFRSMSFTQTFRHHSLRASRRFPMWESYSEELQSQLIVAEYRGDLGQSPRTLRLIREERWREASVEFLRHDEYDGAGALKGVSRRLERLSEMLQKQEVNS